MKRQLDIIKFLPEISEIKNAGIREKTLAVWNKLWEMSKFENIEDLPVNTKTTYPHIVHNRSVVRMAMAVADILEEQHGVKVDRDILISAAVLQDSSKLIEYEPTENGVALSKIGKDFQHGFYAAHIAIEVGLPEEVAAAILLHTYENPKFPSDLITKILFYTDQIDMAALGLDRWKKIGVIFR